MFVHVSVLSLLQLPEEMAVKFVKKSGFPGMCDVRRSLRCLLVVMVLTCPGETVATDL